MAAFSILSLLIASACIAVASLINAAYRNRRIISQLQEQGKPMPPFSWIWGHLLVVKSTIDEYPRNAVFNYVAQSLLRKYGEESMFYMDFWPFNVPLLICANPFAADQLMAVTELKMPRTVLHAFDQLTGGPNLSTMDLAPWKRWRGIFAPGFAPSYMLEQVPKLVAMGEIYCEKLRKHAREGDIFQLEEMTFRLTIDVISEVALDSSFGYQKGDSKFPHMMRQLIETVTFGQDTDPFLRWNIVRPLRVKYWGKALDRYVHAELEKRFEERKVYAKEEKSSSRKKVKSIVALALDNYIADNQNAGSAKLDPEFVRYATAQLRLFLVAGHDTTSSAIIYTLHLLHQHPDALARVRAEHDEVFGPEIADAPAALSTSPHLLNQLPITFAAIKEALRLFPPAGGVRMGHRDVVLTTEDGTAFPTENCAVFIPHSVLHRNPAYWLEPNSFIIDRWLVDAQHPLYPKKGAWRTFEIGPHNCIGQTLALTEIKTILVLALREFDLKVAYDEWYKRKGEQTRTVEGEVAFLVTGGGGGLHPNEKYPCRVAIARK